MEFKMNPHSSKTMDDLKAEFAKEDKKREEMEKAHRREMEKKQREFDIKPTALRQDTKSSTLNVHSVSH